MGIGQLIQNLFFIFRRNVHGTAILGMPKQNQPFDSHKCKKGFKDNCRRFSFKAHGKTMILKHTRNLTFQIVS